MSGALGVIPLSVDSCHQDELRVDSKAAITGGLKTGWHLYLPPHTLPTSSVFTSSSSPTPHSDANPVMEEAGKVYWLPVSLRIYTLFCILLNIFLSTSILIATIGIHVTKNAIPNTLKKIYLIIITFPSIAQ